MFLDFVWFEIKYRFRQISTYVYFLLWFLMMLFSVSTTDFGPVGNGKVMLNGPFALGLGYVQLSAFGVFVISALFGTSILRDFRDNTYQLIFTKPISKFDYLGGRWAGSMVVSAIVFSGLVFGKATQAGLGIWAYMVGTAIHFAFAIAWGVLFAFIWPFLRARRVEATLAALFYAVLAWVVMHLAIMAVSTSHPNYADPNVIIGGFMSHFFFTIPLALVVKHRLAGRP